MLMELLRHETRGEHDLMEADPLSRGLASEQVSHEQYLRALEIYYGFYTPLEASLFALPCWASHADLLEGREKSPLLRHDLGALGLDKVAIAALPTCKQLPPIGTFAQALGCMYVLEGATLGGQLMARHLAQHLGLAPENGAAFFNSYGLELGPRWKQFRAFVDAHANDVSAEEVVESARSTFRAMRMWFAENTVMT